MNSFKKIDGNNKFSCNPTIKNIALLSKLCVNDKNGKYSSLNECIESDECLDKWSNRQELFSSLSIKTYLQDHPSNYKIFNMDYNTKEKRCIDKINISKNIIFTHAGGKNDIDNEELYEFLNDIGSNRRKYIKCIQKLIYKIINTVTAGYETDYFWMDIRVQLPDPYFDIHRWHCDGAWLEYENKKQTKFVTVLKGPGTLLLENNKESRQIYIDIEKQRSDELKENTKNMTQSESFKLQLSKEFREKYRLLLAAALKDANKIQINNDQGLIFTGVDDNGFKTHVQNCTIHSEPVKDSPRIFISIVPGTKEQMRIYLERQKYYATLK